MLKTVLLLDEGAQGGASDQAAPTEAEGAQGGAASLLELAAVPVRFASGPSLVCPDEVEAVAGVDASEVGEAEEGEVGKR